MEISRAAQVTSCAIRSLMWRQKRPAIADAAKGRKIITTSIAGSALHHVDVFDGDGAAIAEIDHQDPKPDGGLRRSHGQHEHGEDLAYEIAQAGREGHQIDVGGEQHELDGHQDDDDVLAVEEDAEDPQGKEDRRHRQVMGKSDSHGDTPLPVGTSLTSMVSPARRANWRAIDWRRTPTRWRCVSTMAPTIATSRTKPAPSKRYT